jgi:hypothetical protein
MSYKQEILTNNHSFLRPLVRRFVVRCMDRH